MKLAVVLVVVGLTGFILCMAYVIYDYMWSTRRRDKHFTSKLKQLEEGTSQPDGLFSSTLPDHFLRGDFSDADHLVMMRTLIHGYSVLMGRWEDWFREADRAFLSGKGEHVGVSKVARWMLMARLDGLACEAVDGIDDDIVRAACKLPSGDGRVAILRAVFESRDTAPSPLNATAVAKILLYLHPTDLSQTELKSAIYWFPPIFMLHPEWSTLSEEDAVNVIITCPTIFIQTQHSIPTRHVLAAMIVAIHDTKRHISPVVDHQLSAYFKQKFIQVPQIYKQLIFMSRLVIPLVTQMGCRVQIPILVDLFTVWDSSLPTDMQGCHDQDDDLEWFKARTKNEFIH